MSRHIGCLCVVSVILSISWTKLEAQNLIQNGSFENGNFVQNGAVGFETLNPGATDITNWTVINAELIWGTTPNDASITAQDGTHFLDLTGLHNSSPYGGVTQTITTTIGQSYHLSLYLGTQQDIPNQRGPVSASVTAGMTSQTFTYDPGGTGVKWGQFSLDFTATSSTTNIDIIGQSGNVDIGLDNVSVTPVPAPSELAAFLIGAVPGAAVLLRRRRKA